MDAYLAYIVKQATHGELILPLGGALYGYSRAQKLYPEERKELIEHYELPERANLALRSAGKGVLGAYGGGLAVSLPASALLAINAAKKSKNKLDLVHKLVRPGIYAPLIGLGSLIGGGIGAHLATRKYSVPGLEKVREQK